MKQILFVYSGMNIGGSTTSLISLLSRIDYKEYEVDILLLNQNCVLMNKLPGEVHVLESPLNVKNKNSIRARKVISIKSWIRLLLAIYYSKKFNSWIVRQQITQHDLVRFCKPVKKRYDIAISFLELWPLYYLAEKVEATKKIAWYHINFLETGMIPGFDREPLKEMDKVVLVSEECKKSFDEAFPEYSSKSIVIENILSTESIREKAGERVAELPGNLGSKVKMVTVCRIVFIHKGLDRGLRALARLKKENLLNEKTLQWYIVGDGPDTERLYSLIVEYGLESIVYPMGKMENPMPIEAQCDVFFLPSLYEGKPMAVTEAQMLGLAPLVTNYTSAREQINDAVDGIIIPNNDEAIYEALKNLVTGRYNIESMKNVLRSKVFSNEEEFQKFDSLLSDGQ